LVWPSLPIYSYRLISLLVPPWMKKEANFEKVEPNTRQFCGPGEERKNTPPTPLRRQHCVAVKPTTLKNVPCSLALSHSLVVLKPGLVAQVVEATDAPVVVVNGGVCVIISAWPLTAARRGTIGVPYSDRGMMPHCCRPRRHSCS
jgi:hypothetical protein